MEEINQTNTQYQKAAINRAKFLLSGNEDVRGQLKELLLGINEAINEEQMDLGGIYRIEFLENLIRIYHSSIIDSNSLYSPIEGKKEFTPAKLELEEPDAELRQEKVRKIAEKMQRILSPEKIDRYVIWKLEGRQEMEANRLPLEDVEDFIKIIYVRLYGQRKNMCYEVIPLKETEVNGYRFTNFMIRRKH